jgi:hypothetical protein
VSRNGAHYEEVKRKSKVIYDPTDESRCHNRNNIDFVPNGDCPSNVAEAQRFFSNLLTEELRLRRLPLYGNLEERRSRLKNLLVVEQMIDLIFQALLRGDEGKEAAMMLIAQAIPCILHLENRVGEKLVTILLAMAATKYQEKHNCRSLTRFANTIQNVFNTRILGSVTRQSQWKLPMSIKGDAVSKVSFSNKKTRLVVDNLTHLISFTFADDCDEDKRQIWMRLIQDYRDAMKILRKRSDYSDEEIVLFQKKIYNFFIALVEQSGAGKEGVTNYIHMLGSGHITYYMKTHRNLYKYSQQGWESLNEKFKLAFFNHTQRGGNFGTNVSDQEKSYLRAIFMFFQREVLWVSGMAEEHFITKYNANEDN